MCQEGKVYGKGWPQLTIRNPGMPKTFLYVEGSAVAPVASAF